MICKLCLLDKELCKSHIIQKSMFKYVNDDSHRSRCLTKDSQLKPYDQNGVKEYLLCKECENKFALYEKYLSETIEFINQQNRSIVRQHNDLKIKIYNFDHQKLKYAILLHLWRLSIHSKKNSFSIYNLGKYQEILRNKLYSQSLFDEDCFPIVIGELYLENMLSPLIATFPCKKINEIYVQQFSLGGLHFVIYMQEKYSKFNEESFLFLRQNGSTFVTTRDVLSDMLDEEWNQSMISYASRL